MLILLILHSSNKLKYIINHGNKKSTFLSFSSICPWIHETWVSILVQTLGRNFRPQPLLQLTTPMTSNLTLSFGAGISRTIGDPLSPWNNFVQVSEKWLWEKKIMKIEPYLTSRWITIQKSSSHKKLLGYVFLWASVNSRIVQKPAHSQIVWNYFNGNFLQLLRQISKAAFLIGATISCDKYFLTSVISDRVIFNWRRQANRK